MLYHFLLQKLTPYVEEINGDYQFKFRRNELLFIAFPHLSQWAWNENYISGVYNSRKPVVHEGTKCSLMSGKGCCQSSYPLLSEDISMTAHSIKILSFLYGCESLSPMLLQENRATVLWV